MTIRFRKTWNGYPDFSFATLDPEKEFALIGQGIAQEALLDTKLATSSGISAVIGSGKTRLYVKSRESKPDGGTLKIGFGSSSADALTAANTGVILAAGEEITLTIPVGSNFFACKSFGNDVYFSSGLTIHDLSI